jgi:formamidopyrimidine-DNA glycosylase
MPELPDLQVFSANLNKELSGKTLDNIVISKGARVNVSESELKKSLHDQKLKSVYREGKELRFAFDNKNILGLHLMLHGKLSWLKDEKVPPHTLLELFFNNNKILALTDYQSNARINLNPEISDVPDALSKDIDIKFWKEKLHSKATIKNLLLDQHIIRGIGNAYADEILWDAGISPFFHQ